MENASSKPMRVVLSAKAWPAQFLRKEPRIVCAATPKCQARIRCAFLSISTELVVPRGHHLPLAIGLWPGRQPVGWGTAIPDERIESGAKKQTDSSRPGWLAINRHSTH